VEASVVQELAFAKLNLILHVGPPRADGLHPICSIFASIDLADDVEVGVADGRSDVVVCPGVHGTNLAETAVAAFRGRVPSLPALRVRIDKRIPVAAGLGGGSADAAAVLRAANRIAGLPLTIPALRELAAGIGSDVPSQIDPRHALIEGVGDVSEVVELPPYGVLVVPQREGLSTAEVYAELDRMRGWRDRLDPGPLHDFVRSPDPGALENDLQPAAVALRPEIKRALHGLRAAGALGSVVSGSGPTCFGLFADRADAQRAAGHVAKTIVTELRHA
jgi:4-diphosphocytidyl-2-C-methyl-D-erythritol kinase